MKFYNPRMIGLALISTLYALATKEQQPHHTISSGYELYVFAIPIDYRNNKDSVEYPGNWDYIGKFSDHIPYCTPGQLQACQLIVDERDTDPLVKGVRKLRSTVKIITSFNSKDRWWYVSNYIPLGSYSFVIRNEETDIGR